MSTKPKTKKYKLIRGGHWAAKGEFLKEGSILELSPRAARALANKVAPVETAPPAKLIQPPAPNGAKGGEGKEGEDEK